MKKVLVTGATGNVGMEVINALHKLDHPLEVYAGVRNPGVRNEKFKGQLARTQKDY